MKHLIMIAIGGAGGALCRYGLSNLINSLFHDRLQQYHFPYGTLSVNIIGSFFIGIMYVLIAERMTLHADWRSIAIIGFLGAFTTFSTFSLETITLLENGHLLTAIIYSASSLLLCIAAAWVAMILTRMI